MHGDVLLSVNALKDARAWLDRALALDGTYAPTLASLGQLHARLEDHEAALAILRPAAAAAPDYYGLQYYLGSALIEAKDYEGAAEASQIATTLSPDSGRAWLQHSVALLGLDRLAASDAALARAAEADPRSVWFFGRAGAAWRQGRDRVAIDDVAAGRLSEVSAHGRAYAALLAALASWRVREPELAVPLLMEAREAADNGTWTANILDFALDRMEGAELLRRAETNGERTEARAYWGLKLLFGGERDAAMPHLTWVRDRGSRDYVEYGYVGDVLKDLDAQTASR